MTLTDGMSYEVDTCEEVLLNGEQCIVWRFTHPDKLASNKIKKAEKERRRKFKDCMGPIHPDTVCLDTRQSAPGRSQFCDAIVYSDHILAWKDSLCQLYSSDSELNMIQKDISGGEQHTWWKGDTPYIAISFYACKGKFMVQPGDRKEAHLLQWIVGYTERDIIVEWRNITQPVQTANNFELAEFYFTDLRFGDCTKAYVTGTFSCRYTTLVFERKFLYYLIQVYIPSILVVILSWVSFWIDIDAVPARVSLGLLTVLTMTTQVSGLTSRQPRVSYIKAMDVWMTACLIFVFGSLVEYCIVNVLYRREKKDEEAFRKRMSALVGAANSAFLVAQNAQSRERKRGPANVSLTSHIQNRTEENPSNCPCVNAKGYEGRRSLYVDVVSRYLFPLSFIIFSMLYWVYYKIII